MMDIRIRQATGIFGILLLTAACVLSAALPQVAAQESGTRLHDLYGHGYMLEESNGDSLPDAVNVRLVLPDRPREEQVITAANIAARLGYETTAMELDLLCRRSRCPSPLARPAILVGPPEAFGIGEASLNRAPGQGTLRWIRDSRFPAGAVLVEGYDATGLLAAGNYLSGRYPALGTPDGPVWIGLRETLIGLAEADSADVDILSLLSLTLQEGRQGITRAVMRLRAGNAGSWARLADSLATSGSSAWSRAIGEAGLYRLGIELTYGDSLRSISLAAPEAQPSTESGEPEGGADPDFALQEFYTTGGIYRDTNRDRVPDDLGAYISYSGTEQAEALVRLAGRIGLETAGIRLPLVYPGADEQHPEAGGFPVLAGTGSYAMQSLRKEGKLLEANPAAGTGYLEFLPGKVGDKNGIALYGGDAAGRSAAADYLSMRLPYQWNYGKGEWELADTQTDVRRFLQGVGGAGQVASGVEKLRTWMERLEGIDPETVSVTLNAEEAPAGLEDFLSGMLQERYPGARIATETHTTGFGVRDTIFSEEIEIPWEVDRFREQFDRSVAPRLGADSEGVIEVRVSEAPQVRDALRREIRRRLSDAGVPDDAVEVRILSAYKQGFSWLADQVIPQLLGREVASVQIRYKHLRDSREIRWQATASPTRWLQEIYPIDGVFERELGLADSAITFEPFYGEEGPTYRLIALDASGDTVLADSFTSKYVVRPYFDHFPKYDSVRVTTGWAYARIGGETLLDRRIRTDIEDFWDHLQSVTYPRLVEYVMDIQDGRPDEDFAPFFDEFRLEVTLSEPDYQLGFLREQISSTEALHEDLYFETIQLFDLIGNRYGVGGLDYPGRILPYIHPPQHGQAGHARISLTGKQEARPQLIFRYREPGGEVKEMRYALPNAPVEDPVLRAVKVREGLEGVGGLYFEVAVDTAANPYEGLKQRDPEYAIDRTFVSAERVKGMLTALGDLHEAGLFQQTLSWDRVEEIGFRFTKEDSLLSHEPFLLRRSSRPASTQPPALPEVDFTYGGQNLVQWETPISPEENNRIMAQLNTFDNISVYHAATSLLGHEVYAMDLLPPVEAPYRSQAKLNALKPTLFISGRQHANEFSSTSHMLKLAEKVATDSTYRRYLDRINLVLHPVTNPDGAGLAVELNEINPYHMHHAGYLGPLGVDIPRDQNNRDPRYEVAKVRREIHDAWLPDIYINMHGYPPHEWVQYFAGYSAWMTGRERGPSSNNYWIPRGYFLTGFSWYDNEDFPFNKELSFALLDSISTRVNAVPAMRRVNEEMQRRYRKYRSQEDAYGEFYRNGLWVNSPLTGREFTGSGFSDPRVTYFTLTSEAPDEPAQGEWMQMNAAAGLAHSTAILQYLYHGVNEMTTEAEMESGRVRRARYRVKPVLPVTLYRLKKAQEGN